MSDSLNRVMGGKVSQSLKPLGHRSSDSLWLVDTRLNRVGQYCSGGDKAWTSYDVTWTGTPFFFFSSMFPPTAHNSALCHRLANTPVPRFHLVCRGPKALDRR